MTQKNLVTFTQEQVNVMIPEACEKVVARSELVRKQVSNKRKVNIRYTSPQDKGSQVQKRELYIEAETE